jgi:septum formation protein
VAEIDESLLPLEKPQDYVVRIALEKARSVKQTGVAEPILSADTAVVVDGKILGKPGGRDEAITMLKILSGIEHHVYTAVALLADYEATRLNISQVMFRSMTHVEIEKYCDSGEPMDKAGGYGIQGIGAIFIENLQGSYSGVMGLPLFETAELLGEFNIEIL